MAEIMVRKEVAAEITALNGPAPGIDHPEIVDGSRPGVAGRRYERQNERTIRWPHHFGASNKPTF